MMIRWVSLNFGLSLTKIVGCMAVLLCNFAFLNLNPLIKTEFGYQKGDFLVDCVWGAV